MAKVPDLRYTPNSPVKAAAQTEQDMGVHKRAIKRWNGKKVVPQRKFDDKCAARFLANYAMTGRKGDSAIAAGISYSTVRAWEVTDDGFQALILDAHEEFVNRLEREMYRRGVEGVEEPVYAGKDGDLVGYQTKFSDKLLELLVKKADPSGYGNKEAIQVNVNTGVLLAPPPVTEETTTLIIEEVEEEDDQTR